MKSKIQRIAKWSLAGVILLLIAIQFVPINRSNPPVEGEPPFPDAVRSILSRACYDCHSNKTVWPWYSRIAPLSWLIAHDVSEGRGMINFSTWKRLGARDQIEAIDDIRKQTTAGDMPLWYYLPAHPQARLSAGDVATLRDWALSVAPTETQGD